MMASSLGENSKLDDAFADSNLASTNFGRVSERPAPSSILVGYEGGVGSRVQVDAPALGT